jgi:hypothetical protein
MLRHVVCFTWNDRMTPGALDAIEAALGALPTRIPEIRAYSFGRDAGLADGNAAFGIVADFDDVDGWRTYQQDAEHQRIVVELFRPYLATRTAAQFVVD